MSNILRQVVRYATLLVFLAVLAQVAGAAYGGFYSADKLGDQKGPDASKMINEKQFDHGFGFHTGFGYVIFLAAVVLLVLALLARIGRPRIWQYVALPVLVAIQIVLAWASENVPGVGILHGLNALIIFGLTGSLVFREWRQRRLERDEVPAGSALDPR